MNAAEVSIQLSSGDVSLSTFNKINVLLDRIHEENPGIRIFGNAKGENVEEDIDYEALPDDEVEAAIEAAEERQRIGRGGIRARVYQRHGWKKLYEYQSDDGPGAAMMEWLPPDQRPPRTSGYPTAFDGIDAYADAIMALV